MKLIPLPNYERKVRKASKEELYKMYLASKRLNQREYVDICVAEIEKRMEAEK